MEKLITRRRGSTIIVSQWNYYCEGSTRRPKLCPDKKISERETGCERESKSFGKLRVLWRAPTTPPIYNLNSFRTSPLWLMYCLPLATGGKLNEPIYSYIRHIRISYINFCDALFWTLQFAGRLNIITTKANIETLVCNKAKLGIKPGAAVFGSQILRYMATRGLHQLRFSRTQLIYGAPWRILINLARKLISEGWDVVTLAYHEIIPPIQGGL